MALEGDARNAAMRNANACQQLVELCGEVLEVAPELTAREFLRTLGALVAGIDLDLKGFRQLARGGANGLIGAGFRAEYDDGTAGQARHFAGTAAAAALIGEKPAELLAHHVVDPAESIDGHLSTAALEFARLLIEGELPLAEAGGWIAANVCDPAFQTDDGSTPFDALVERSATAEGLRARFSDAEWRELTELPERVAVAAALSDATGGFEDAKDLVAGMRQIETGSESESELVRALVAERYDEGFAWGDDDRSPDERVEDTLRAVREELRVLQARAIATGEIVAYANFLMEIARTAVRGSRSGGFLGIGGSDVSQRESAFLSRLEDVLEAGLPACEGCLG
ncbi:MAG: hypothetical protein R2855_00870 [Thermomicrobiales bacterium]